MSNPYTDTCQLFNPQEIEALRHGGKILHNCLRETAKLVKPGVTTKALDEFAESFIKDHDGAWPGFKGYHGFPGTLCTSVNKQAVHAIPNKTVLQEGDIVGIDCGVKYQGLVTDSAITVPVGKIPKELQNLLAVTQDALDLAVAEIKAGVAVGTIGAIIEATVKHGKYNVLKELTGHGLGDDLLQFPTIFNYGKTGKGTKLPANTIVAIEPITTLGKNGIITDDDGWSVNTIDGSPSAHFEYTVLVLENGCEILT
jgi:methionyl aminopeptidase